ncbi:MAG: type II secretion system minor pseudopilin GspH [Woeseiaceae bacterium]|nr:type II secretion system minor pseudopilin GspH [Woeseiaceae bacterium]
MPGRDRGFTLIEILVSIVIVGILISVAVVTLSLASDDRALREEARRFMTLMDVLQDEAMMQGRDFGIEFLRAGYRFVEYDPLAASWAEVPNDDILVLRALPDDLELDLFLEEKRVLLQENPKRIQSPDEDRPQTEIENYAPHILVYSSGDMTPFELYIERATDRMSVGMRGDLLGNIEVIEDDADYVP